jgi:hypothetical protein
MIKLTEQAKYSGAEIRQCLSHIYHKWIYYKVGNNASTGLLSRDAQRQLVASSRDGVVIERH